MKNLMLFPFKLISMFLQALHDMFFPPVTINKVLQQALDEALLAVATHTASAERCAADARNHRTLAEMNRKRIERLRAEITSAKSARYPAPDRHLDKAPV